MLPDISLNSFLPLGVVFVAVFVILWLAHWLLIRRFSSLGRERNFLRQLSFMGLVILAGVAIILALPLESNVRDQLLKLAGILISGIFAFASTTIVSNLMAGVLMRITKPFRIGDFITIGSFFGRVSERGLFDTEIQTQSRELISIPNTYCITNPVTTIRSSGTIISTTLSLGYDVHHGRIETLLIEAAEHCALAEPFVRIMELGDFSVSYRVAGFLEEPKNLLMMRSNLNAAVLDRLHEEGIEIMSPTYMNQRRLHDDERAIPPAEKTQNCDKNNEETAEQLAFDKAEQAEEAEQRKQQLSDEISSIDNELKECEDPEQKKSLQDQLKQCKEQLKELEKAAPPADE